jgi:hypothetical protein
MEAFIFAGQALERFQSGSTDDKRAILKEIGSNFYLKDQKLIIEPEKPLLIIEKGLKVVSNHIQRLEPPNNGFIVGENPSSFPTIPSWLATIDDVRTFFRQQNEQPL